MKKFCPNCGHAVKSDATFCPNCGYNLLNKESKVNQVNSGSVKKVEKSKFCPICGKKIKADAKICPNCGHSFVEKKVDTGKNSSSQRRKPALQDVEINNNTIKPLRTYYQNNKKVVDTMRSDYKAGLDSSEHVDLVQSGHYMLIFPKYVLKVKTYSPKIQTNHYNSTLNMNKQNMGSLRGSGDNYSKKISAILPGEYHFIINSQVSGRKLSATSNVDVWSNKAIDMNIRTDTFTVKSVPNGLVYINDKKVGTFVNGSDNSDYKDIKKLHSDWDSQDVDLTDFSVEIESIIPAGDNYSAVNFKAKFEFQGDDFSKDQTMEYTGALLYNKDDDTDKQKVKSIGKSKMLSSKKHDLDDDDD